MTREEFEKRVDEGKKMPTSEEYSIIEKVYTFHPSISETEGKSQIALIYNTFGMAVIRDMLPRAELMRKKEEAFTTARLEMQRIKDEMENIRNGGEI